MQPLFSLIPESTINENICHNNNKEGIRNTRRARTYQFSYSLKNLILQTSVLSVKFYLHEEELSYEKDQVQVRIQLSEPYSQNRKQFDFNWFFISDFSYGSSTMVMLRTYGEVLMS